MILINSKKNIYNYLLNSSRFCYFTFTEDVKLLKVFTKILSANCDDVYEFGYRASGIYDIFTGERVIETFCELEQIRNNSWLVSRSYCFRQQQGTLS